MITEAGLGVFTFRTGVVTGVGKVCVRACVPACVCVLGQREKEWQKEKSLVCVRLYTLQFTTQTGRNGLPVHGACAFLIFGKGPMFCSYLWLRCFIWFHFHIRRNIHFCADHKHTESLTADVSLSNCPKKKKKASINRGMLFFSFFLTMYTHYKHFLCCAWEMTLEHK